MKKFQYLTALSQPNVLDNVLNEAGGSGYELSAMTWNPIEEKYQLVFKKEI